MKAMYNGKEIEIERVSTRNPYADEWHVIERGLHTRSFKMPKGWAPCAQKVNGYSEATK